MINKELNISKDENRIKDKIHTLRGVQVMIDRDLAIIYNVSTKAINQAVKRNIGRFPEDFVFRLSKREKDELVTNCDQLRALKHSYHLPYAFTEEGVAMLSGVLKSVRASEINILIMRAFVAMRRFIASNAQVFHRLDNLEYKQIEHDKNFEKVFDAIEEKNITPKQGIFFDGQVFDAYKFVFEIIKSAEKSITLIDNYIDECVLTLLSNKNYGVIVTVHTANVSESLLLAKDKFNKQYGMLEIKEFNLSHDRFLIIDDKEIYHIGASLKDLGKKWFAFSKLGKDAFAILEKLNKLKNH